MIALITLNILKVLHKETLVCLLCEPLVKSAIRQPT